MSVVFAVQFGGQAVRFTAQSRAMLAPLAAHLRHCRADSQPVVAEFHITAISDTAFCLSENGSGAFFRLERETVWQVLMQEALARLNGACISAPVFHAAALADERGGVILCGPSGSGKSTLTAWMLASRGFRYLSDEVIACADVSGQISGFARSLVLKKGSAFLWQQFLGAGKRPGLLHFPDGSAWIDPFLLSHEPVCPQAVPRLLLFPRYVPDAPFRVTQLTPAESLFRLLQTLVNARNLPEAGMGSAARLTRRVTAYAVEYSDLETVAAWIQQT